MVLAISNFRPASSAPPPPAPAAAAPPAPMAPARREVTKQAPWRPLAYGTLAASGKLVSAIGASAAVRASETHATPDKAVAGLLLGSGLCAAVSAALLFGADAAHVTGPRRAAVLKTVSISSALCLAAGAALRQLGQSKAAPACIWGAYAISTTGYALVGYSLPSFFSLSETRRGRAIVRNRSAVAWGLIGAGLAATQGWANSTPPISDDLPPYLSSVVLTVGATASLLGLAIVCADEQAPRLQAARTDRNSLSEAACA